MNDIEKRAFVSLVAVTLANEIPLEYQADSMIVYRCLHCGAEGGDELFEKADLHDRCPMQGLIEFYRQDSKEIKRRRPEVNPN